MLTGLGVSIANAPQRNRASLGLDTGEENGLVASQTFCFKDWMALNHAVSGVTLLPVDKENSFAIQGVKPSVIDIGPIHGDDAIRGQLQSATYGDVVGLAIGNSDKAGKQTIVIETNMDLHSTFCASEFRPGKDRKTQVNRGRVQGIKFVAEAKAMLRRQSVTTS